jgi:hypothetical protein
MSIVNVYFKQIANNGIENILLYDTINSIL